MRKIRDTCITYLALAEVILCLISAVSDNKTCLNIAVVIIVIMLLFADTDTINSMAVDGCGCLIVITFAVILIAILSAIIS